MTGSPSAHHSMSVVIPTYNRSNLVERSIRSALAQSSAPDEVIVVDDGSSDDTAMRIESFGGRVRYVHQEHGGASRARNTGVAAASSTWIAFLDSDDVWSASYLERMRRSIEATEGKADFYFSDAEWVRDSGLRSHWERCHFRCRGEWQLEVDASPWVLSEVQPMLLPFTVVRAASYRACGGLREDFRTGEDTHFFMKLGVTGTACAVAGSGGRVMADDEPGNRLSAVSRVQTWERWTNYVSMYEDLCTRFPNIKAGTGRTFRYRLANGHWRLSRLAFANRSFGRFARELITCLRSDPLWLFRLIIAPFARNHAFLRP